MLQKQRSIRLVEQADKPSAPGPPFLSRTRELGVLDGATIAVLNRAGPNQAHQIEERDVHHRNCLVCPCNFGDRLCERLAALAFTSSRLLSRLSGWAARRKRTKRPNAALMQSSSRADKSFSLT